MLYHFTVIFNPAFHAAILNKPLIDVLSQGILSSSTTCGISGCSEEALHVRPTANWR